MICRSRRRYGARNVRLSASLSKGGMTTFGRKAAIGLIRRLRHAFRQLQCVGDPMGRSVGSFVGAPLTSGNFRKSYQDHRPVERLPHGSKTAYDTQSTVALVTGSECCCGGVDAISTCAACPANAYMRLISSVVIWGQDGQNFNSYRGLRSGGRLRYYEPGRRG